MITQEQLELRKKWVAVLRSGQYKQTMGALKTDKGYCCLGVLCEVAGLLPHKQLNYTWTFEGCTNYLPWSVVTKAGFDSENATFNNISLAQLNDDGQSFEYIADFIEANLEN